MKNTYIIIGVVVLVAIIAFVYGSRKEGLEQNTVNETLIRQGEVTTGSYRLNNTSSLIVWKAELTAGSYDEETLRLRSGELSFVDGKVATSSFVIDSGTRGAGGYFEIKSFEPISAYSSSSPLESNRFI